MTSPNYGNPQGPGPSGHHYSNQQFGGSIAWNGSGQPAYEQPQAPLPAPKRSVHLGWPAWAYLGLTLLTLIGSFFTVVTWAAAFQGFGSAGVSWNWWGSFAYEGTGLGSLAADYIPAELGYDSGMVVATAAVLLLLVATCVVVFIGRIRPGAILGIVASAAQLVTVIVAYAQTDTTLGMRMGPGWYIWLLASLAGLAISIYLVATGRGKQVAPPPNPYGNPYGNPGQPGQPGQWGQGGQGR